MTITSIHLTCEMTPTNPLLPPSFNLTLPPSFPSPWPTQQLRNLVSVNPLILMTSKLTTSNISVPSSPPSYLASSINSFVLDFPPLGPQISSTPSTNHMIQMNQVIIVTSWSTILYPSSMIPTYMNIYHLLQMTKTSKQEMWVSIELVVLQNTSSPSELASRRLGSKNPRHIIPLWNFRKHLVPYHRIMYKFRWLVISKISLTTIMILYETLSGHITS